jgi:predicted ester cyclase
MEEVWNQRNEATIEALLHPQAVGHMEGAVIRSIPEFRAVWSAILTAFPDLRMVVEDTVAEGDQVALRWRAFGTHLGELMGIAPSRRQVEFRGMNWLRFSSGQIVEGWDSWNQGSLFESLRAPLESA